MDYDADIDFEGGDRPPTAFELAQDLFPFARSVTIVHTLGVNDYMHDECIEYEFLADPDEVNQDLTGTNHDVIGMRGPGKANIRSIEIPDRSRWHEERHMRYLIKAAVLYEN